MNSDLIESKSTFGLHLEGDNEIEATLLSNTIRDIAELTKLAAKEEDPQAYLKMNVKALKNGSFEIDFSAVCLVGMTLICNAPSFALKIIEIVKGFLEIKKLLKGEEPKNIETTDDGSIKVEGSKGDSIIVPKSSKAVIYDTKIENLTINITKHINEHNPKGGFTLKTQSGDSNFTSEDMLGMLNSIPNEQITNCKRIEERTQLYIKKPDLIGLSKWDFIYKNRIISANIEDAGWISRVNNGTLVIRAGDYIDATLLTYVETDEEERFLLDTAKYTVLKIHGDIHHKPSEQTSMLT